MATLALPHSILKVSGPSSAASDLFLSSRTGLCGVPLKALGRSRLSVVSKRDFTVSAKGKKKNVPEGVDPNLVTYFPKIIDSVAQFEIIRKLHEEYNEEFKKAVQDLGFMDRVEMLQEEYAKTNKEVIDPILMEKKEKLMADIKMAIIADPNETLSSKKEVIDELSLQLSQQQKIDKKFKEKVYRATLKKKLEALESDLVRARGSNDEDLIKELEEKKRKVKKEVELEVIYVLESILMDSKRTELVSETVQGILSDEGSPGDHLKSRTEELRDDAMKLMIEAINSSTDLMNDIELLKSEMAKAGETPDVETKNKIAALNEEISKKITKASLSSPLGEKCEQLNEEIDKAVVSSLKEEFGASNDESVRV